MKTLNIKNLIMLAGGVLMSTIFGACGQSQVALKSMAVYSSVEQDTVYLNLDSDLTFGDSVSINGYIPIPDPMTGQNAGFVKVEPSSVTAGQTKLQIKANLDVLVHADHNLGQKLPNGYDTPVSPGINRSDIFGVPILNNSVVYLAGDSRTEIFLGVALGIKDLDQAFGKLGGAANLFAINKFTDQIYGIAGVYANSVAEQNGFAIFGSYKINAQNTLSQKSTSFGPVLGSKQQFKPVSTTILQQGPWTGEAFSKLRQFFESNPKHIRLR